MRITDTFPKPHTVEIEFRIGSTVAPRGDFVSNLESHDFFHMLKLVFGRIFRRLSNEESIDASLLGGTSSAGKTRWTCNPTDPTQPPKFEEKAKLHVAPLPKTSPQQLFATRLSASVEHPKELPTIAPDTIVSVRKKMRRRFTPHAAWIAPPYLNESNFLHTSPIILTEYKHPLQGLIRIDLTEVRQRDCTFAETFKAHELDFNEKRSLYELEIELLPAGLSAIKFAAAPSGHDHVDQTERIQIVAAIVDFLRDLHTLFQQAWQDRKFADVFLQPIYDNATYWKLLSRFNLAFGRQENMDSFPGCMPVSLFKQTLSTIKDNPYLVSEKTDGLRFLMLLTKNRENPSNPGGAIYFINRSMQFFQVRGRLSQALVDAVATDGDTVIDGELVRHVETSDPIFLAYDVIQWSDCNMMDSPYSVRLNFVKRLVEKFEKIHPKDVTTSLADMAFPFRIMRKNVFPKEEIGQIFSRIAGTGTKIYRDPTLGQCHPTDGLIFCPDGPYQMGSQLNLYKWKYADKLTVDLRVQFITNAPSTVYLWCKGRQDPFVAELLPRDLYRLHQDLSAVGYSDHNIAEFGLENNGKQWRYHLLRVDKQEPNWVGTVDDTMKAMIENLTGEEIQRLIRPL